MSMFSDFAGGFVGGVKDVVDQNIANNMEMERYKKQLEIQEEMRKKAEEAKVAARRMFNVGGRTRTASADDGRVQQRRSADR